MRLVPISLAFVLWLAWPPPGFAQTSAVAAPAIDRTWEVEPYLGVARHSPAGTHLGITPDRNHLFIGLHVTGAILHWRGFTLAYAPEIVPLLLLSDTPKYTSVPMTASGDTYTGLAVEGSGNVAGFGASPVGFEGRVRFGSRLRLYTATAAGVVVFTRDTPFPGARPFNFTFEVGGGADVRLTSVWWLRLGYKFHHLSNANSAPLNPGVDAKVVMAGLVRAIGRR